MVDLRCCQRELGHEIKQVSGGVHLQTASRGETANCWCNLPFPPRAHRASQRGRHARTGERQAVVCAEGKAYLQDISAVGWDIVFEESSNLHEATARSMGAALRVSV